MANQEHIALVAAAIKASEKTRAEIKRDCNISYADIEPALYHLVFIQVAVKSREDGSGIEHFSWIKSKEFGTQHTLQSGEDSMERKTPSTLGVSVSAEVLEFIRVRPLNYEFTSTQITEYLRKQFPILKECDVPANVNTAVSAALNQLCAKRVIAIVHKGKAGRTHIYARLKTAEDNHNKTLETDRHSPDCGPDCNLSVHSEHKDLGIETIVESSQEVPELEFKDSTAPEPENQPTELQTAKNEPFESHPIAAPMPQGMASYLHDKNEHLRAANVELEKEIEQLKYDVRALARTIWIMVEIIK